MKLLFLCFSGIFFTQTVFAQNYTCAKVALRIGKVEIKPSQQIKPGTPLAVGSTIRTGKDSFAKLKLVDNSIVDIGPESQFKLVKCESSMEKVEIDLELELGGIRANVVPSPKRKKFEVKTPTSLLGVRGTEFFVSWMRDSSGQVFEQVAVSRGEVLVSQLFDPRLSPTLLRTGTELRSTGKQGGPLESRVDQFNAAEQRRFEQKTRVGLNEAIEALKLEDLNRNDRSDRNDRSSSLVKLNKAAEKLLTATMMGDEPASDRNKGPASDQGRGRGPASEAESSGAPPKNSGASGEGRSFTPPGLEGVLPGRGSEFGGGPPPGVTIPILKAAIIEWTVKKP